MTNKYVAYSRVSTKAQKDRDNSLPAQNRIISEYAEKKGLEISDWYSEAKSGYKGKRSEFNRMLEHLRTEEIEGVIFHKLDRSARNVGDFALLDKLLTQGKRIIIIEGEFDTTRAAGRLAFRNFCNLCVWYSENLSEEVSTKMEEVLMKGYFPAHAPVGYREGLRGVDEDPKQKYADEKLAPFVKEAFKLMATSNYSIRSLCEYLRDKGMTNTKGTPVRKGVFENVLRNPFYHGLIRWRKRCTGQASFYEGNHEPLISKELFDRVQNILDGKRQRGRSKHNHIYARLIKCECGNVLVSGLHKGRVYLECHNGECQFTSIRQDRLEEQIVIHLAKYEIGKELFPHYEEAFHRLRRNIRDESKNRRKAINLHLGQLEKKLDNLHQAMLSDFFTAEEAVEAKNSIIKQRQQLRRELEEFEDRHEDSLWQTTLECISMFNSLPYRYRQLNPLLKRRLIGFVFLNLRLQGSRLLCEAVPAFEKLKITNNYLSGQKIHLNHQQTGDYAHSQAILREQGDAKKAVLQNGGPRRPCIETSEAEVTLRCVEETVQNIKKYLTGMSLAYCEEMINGIGL